LGFVRKQTPVILKIGDFILIENRKTSLVLQSFDLVHSLFFKSIFYSCIKSIYLIHTK